MNIELKERLEMQAYNLLREIEETESVHQEKTSDKYLFFVLGIGISIGVSLLAFFELIVVPLVGYVKVLIF